MTPVPARIARHTAIVQSCSFNVIAPPHYVWGPAVGNGSALLNELWSVGYTRERFLFMLAVDGKLGVSRSGCDNRHITDQFSRSMSAS
jgi:hypothetical protein